VRGFNLFCANNRILDSGTANAVDTTTLRPYLGGASTFDAPRVPIPLSHVQLISALYRALPAESKAAASESGTFGGWVHELTAGSEVIPIAPATKKKVRSRNTRKQVTTDLSDSKWLCTESRI
jgi:hypothetical protein